MHLTLPEKAKNAVIRPRRSSGLRIAAVLAGAVAALFLARDVLIPLAFAITLALLLSPGVGGLQKLRFRRFPAVLTMMLFSVAVSAGAGYVIFNQLLEVINELPRYQQNIDNKILALRTPSKGALSRAAESVKQLGNELVTPTESAASLSHPQTSRTSVPGSPVPVEVVEPPANSLVYLRDVTRPFLGPLATLGIVLVFTVFLLVEASDLRNRLFGLAGMNRLNLMTEAFDDATRRVSRYLMLQFLVNAGFGILIGTGLYLIGIPYAVLWGTVAAILRIVPYVGSVAAGCLPFILSLAVFDGWRQPLLVFVLFAVLELITGNFLEPLLYGAHTGISSLALLVTTVFWATLWGPAGLILATPLTVCVVVLGRHIPHLSFLHVLLGDQPALATEALFYQRLLAMDDQEARTIAEQYLSANSLLRLYDSIILPALALAEHDRHKNAIDPEREEFLFLSVREILSEFYEKVQLSSENSSSEKLPSVAPLRVICFSAHDEADEIAVAMLSQLLEQAGIAVVTVPLGSSSQNILDLIEPTESDVFCISSVPPFAFSHARVVNRLLRAKFPRTRILMCVWGFSGEVKPALQRFRPVPPDSLAVTLAEALEYFGVSVSDQGATESEGKVLNSASSSRPAFAAYWSLEACRKTFHGALSMGLRVAGK